MKHFYFFILLILSISDVAFSQKSAPIAGDASILIDYLKKAYDNQDENKNYKELSRDQKIVIQTFKTYSSIGNFSGLKAISYKLDKVDLVYSRIITELGTTSQELVKRKKKLEELKKNPSAVNYETALKNVNESELELLKLNFKKNLLELVYLKQLYVNNKYVEEILDRFIKKYSGIYINNYDPYIQVNYEQSIQKSLLPLGGSLEFKTLIDGLSRFLAKRIKAELTNYVMDNIKRELENPKPTSWLNELVVILPTTTDFIKQFDAEEILNFTNDLKQYIEKDLNNLLGNAAQLKTTPRFERLINNNPDLDFAFEALELYPTLSKIENPIDYFDLLEQSRTISRWDNANTGAKLDIANTIKLCSLLAHSLTIIDEGEIKFVSTKFMSNYGSQPEFFMLYFGFLHQQETKFYQIKFNAINDFSINLIWGSGILPVNKVNQLHEDVRAIQTSLSTIVQNAEKIYQEAGDIKRNNKNEGTQPDIEVIHSFVNRFIEFLEQTASTGDVLLEKFIHKPSNKVKIADQIKPYTNTAKKVNNITLDLHHKKYTNAIIGVLEIPSNFSNSKWSSDRLMNLTNDIKNVSEMYQLRALITKYPYYKDKLKNDTEFKNLISLVRNSLSANTSEIMIARADIIAFEKNMTKETYKDFIEQLSKKEFIMEAVVELAKIDTNIILKDITSKIKDPSIKKDLKDALNNYVMAGVENYLTKQNFDKKDLDNEKEALLNVIRLNFSELIDSVFSIKDQNAVKIIHFVNDIAISEKPEDVEKALEAFALPTGSYTVKRKSVFNVSLNSYPGLLGGLEFSDYNNNKAKFATGFTAPVGLSLGTSWSGFIEGIHIFIPIIDIAAPVRFRLDNDNNTETLPEFEFENIFSPGVYLSFPFRKSPFAFNIGVQYGPDLNFKEEIVVSDKETFSFNAAFVIDIPLFTIYNKPSNHEN